MRIIRCKRGVAAMEYGIVAGILGLTLIAMFHAFGNHLVGMFGIIGKSI